MTGTDVLRMQITGSFNLLTARLDEITAGEWDRRAAPGTSRLGFILWHAARILDWTVHSALQGAPEVADRSPWRERFAREACYGAGIPEGVADSIAHSTNKEDVAAYLAEVRDAFMDWFGRQTDATLDAPVPLRANQASRPDYLEPDVWAEVADLDGLPGWQLLARPAVSHIRVHVGEYDTLAGLLRAGASTPRA